MANRTNRTPENEVIFLEAVAKGACVRKACRLAGIGRRTVYDWRDQCPAFAEKWRAAKRTARASKRNKQFGALTDAVPIDPILCAALRVLRKNGEDVMIGLKVVVNGIEEKPEETVAYADELYRKEHYKPLHERAALLGKTRKFQESM